MEEVASPVFPQLSSSGPRLSRLSSTAVNESLGVGCGEVAKGTRPELFVDVTNPRAPQTLGFFPVKDLPSIGDILVTPDLSVILSSDISLSGGGKAVIIGGLSSIGFGPMRLFKAGDLTNIGSRMALTQDGILVSTDRVYVSGVTTSENGVHTAALTEVGIIPKPLPAVTKPANNNQTEQETINEIPIQPAVLPLDTGVQQATVALFLDGAPMALPFTVPLVMNRGMLKLAAGFRAGANSVVTAVMSFLGVDGKTHRSVPTQIPLGMLTVRVDSNNDTMIADKGTAADNDDARADQEARADTTGDKQGFVFWERNPSVKDEGALVDFATVRVRLGGPLSGSTRVALRMQDSQIDVKVKTLAGSSVADGCDRIRAYLCDPLVAAAEVAELKGATATPSYDPNVGTMPAPLLTAPIRRATGLYELPWQLLVPGDSRSPSLADNPPALIQPGEIEFLFACSPGSGGKYGCPADEMELGVLNESNEFVKVDGTRVHIRPVTEMATIVSARRSEPPDYDQYKVSPVIRTPSGDGAPPVIGWAPLHKDKKTMNLLVHGFNVSDDEFKTDTFPTFVKRLYWVGHPVLQPQDAWTVGLAWPGDINIPAIPADAVLFFPEDEFTGLQAGVPLAKFIGQTLAQRPSGGQLNILAHSLGNLVVNSALQQLGGSSGLSPIRYVMNEAAVAADAFDANYTLTPDDQAGDAPRLLEHAVRLGYAPRNAVETQVLVKRGFSPIPTAPDTPWSAQWDQIQWWRQQDLSLCIPNSAPECHGVLKWLADYPRLNPVLSAGVPVGDARDFFVTRWSRNGWRGLFASNLQLPNVRIYNTYNPQDWALRIDQGVYGFPMNIAAFFSCETRMKPYSGAAWAHLWEATDDLIDMRWPLLNPIDTHLFGRSTNEADVIGDQNYIWGDGGDHSWETRHWAELAYWFPAFTEPAGAQPVQAIETQRGRNENMQLLGAGDEGGISVLSHGYLKAKEFSKVFRAWQKIGEKFKEQ